MMRKVTVRNFKRFTYESFDLADSVVLAGPNNAGKTTLLQAIATWKFGLDRWVSRRAGTSAGQRTGIPITRAEFVAVPLREMNLLWEDRRVAPKAAEPVNRRFIEIVAEGGASGEEWTCGLEFQYANAELVYVRPLNAKKLSKSAIRDFPAQGALDLKVLHVPALSGIERDEPRRERGMQDLLVGQGRPGEILRNLLWEITERSEQNWEALTSSVRNLFGMELIKPSYSSADPYIVCEYREGPSQRPLDLSNAGSGTLQVLLLLAFLYSRPASVILLDEPDAHQHVILQEQVYRHILRLARSRQAQVLIATHSEVILNATEPTRVYGFIGDSPRLLATRVERDSLREALKPLSTTDLLLGQEVGALLYVEGESDERIMAEWARVLGHRAEDFFQRPFIRRLGGRDLGEARSHFFAMRAAFPKLRAACLLDGDNRDEPDAETIAAGLVVLRWRRYEIENYLLQPEAVNRFLGFPLLAPRVESAFWKHVPEGTDLFGDHVALSRVKASDEFLVPLFRSLDVHVSKRDLYQIAAGMLDTEIHPEVKEKLDRIAECLLPGDSGPPQG